MAAFGTSNHRRQRHVVLAFVKRNVQNSTAFDPVATNRFLNSSGQYDPICLAPGMKYCLPAIAMFIATAMSSSHLDSERHDYRRQSPTLGRVLSAYGDGDYDSVQQFVAVAKDFPKADVLEHDLRRLTGYSWELRANFLLEVAMAAGKANAAEAQRAALSVGGTFVLQRPRSEVTSQGDDFETLWHLAAIGLLQGQTARLASVPAEAALAVMTENRYLDVIDRRYPMGQRDRNARFDLARAIARVHECCTRAALVRFDDVGVDGGRRADTDVLSRAPLKEPPTDWVTRTRSGFIAALDLFARSSRQPAVEAEALVRGAFLLDRLGRLPEAREWLSRVNDDPGDPVLEYWTHLVRGRVLTELELPAIAEPEFRAALRLYPGARSASAGLGLALFQLHRASEAAAVTAAAWTASSGTTDLWLMFDAADERLVKVWRDRLRKFNR
jgi:tetratricopeptide (TPR) repeat protein